MAEFTIRKATMEDAKQLFDWANDKAVRLNSINTDVVKWKPHLSWLQSKLCSETKILILEVDNKPAGQVRFDFDADEKHWTIDYSISADYRGKGLGKKMVEEGLNCLHSFPVVAFVKPENIPSIRVFESLGFENTGRHSIKNIELFKFIKANSL